jgi:predicted nucleotidyltransferase
MKQLDTIKPELEAHGVTFAALFGSRATGTQKDSSDYDILIEFDPQEKPTLLVLSNLKSKIENKLNSSVDLVTTKALHPYIRRQVISNLQVFYDRRS